MKYLLIVVSLCAFPAFALNGVGVAGKVEKVAPSSSVPISASSSSVPHQPALTADQLVQLQNENLKMQFDLIAAVSRLSSLEDSRGKASERADSASIRSSLFAFRTVVFSIAFGLVGQYILMRHQRSLNREQEKAKVSNSYIEWQLKQLSELYGPLRALLGQSIAIYRQMNMVLIAADDKKFRLEEKDGADFDNAEFQILLDGKWERFRTVEHLHVIYKKGYGVEPYFDDVVKAGATIANMIRESAGYVRQEDKELIKVMGSYLAHYGVLYRLHQLAVKGDDVEPAAADIKASFPYIIHELVDNGFNAINRQIMDWKSFRPAQEN